MDLPALKGDYRPISLTGCSDANGNTTFDHADLKPDVRNLDTGRGQTSFTDLGSKLPEIGGHDFRRTRGPRNHLYVKNELKILSLPVARRSVKGFGKQIRVRH